MNGGMVVLSLLMIEGKLGFSVCLRERVSY